MIGPAAIADQIAAVRAILDVDDPHGKRRGCFGHEAAVLEPDLAQRRKTRVCAPHARTGRRTRATKRGSSSRAAARLRSRRSTALTPAASQTSAARSTARRTRRACWRFVRDESARSARSAPARSQRPKRLTASLDEKPNWPPKADRANRTHLAPASERRPASAVERGRQQRVELTGESKWTRSRGRESPRQPRLLGDAVDQQLIDAMRQPPEAP